MKSKTLRGLGQELKKAFKQFDRAKNIKRLAQDKNPFAQLLFYENLIVFQLGIIFERINLLHLLSLYKNQITARYDLPNFENLMNSYTLGSVIKLATSVLDSYPKTIKRLNSFNQDRKSLTHKMFDIKRMPKDKDLLTAAKRSANLGKIITEELSQIAIEIEEQRKKVEDNYNPDK